MILAAGAPGAAGMRPTKYPGRWPEARLFVFDERMSMDWQPPSAPGYRGPGVVVHPLAAVDDGAALGDRVEVGPFASVAGDVELGAGCRVMTHATVLPGVRRGPCCEVHPGAVLGGEPQNRSYRPSRTFLEVGPRTVFREYVTVSRATRPGEATRIGADCLFMAGSHVGHDCVIGDRVALANCVQLAGYCQAADAAVVGGATSVHQFVRIGRHAMIGGGSGLTQDAPPFMLTAGIAPAVVYGVNLVGLRRSGTPAAIVEDLKRAFRLLYRSGLNVSQALERIREELAASPEVSELVGFIAESKRGLCAGARQRRAQPSRNVRGGAGGGR